METATATQPAKPMYVKGLDDPKALKIQFRRPTPLVVAALHFVLEKNDPWVKLQINTNGNYFLVWDQSTLSEYQRSIQNLKADIERSKVPNRALNFEVLMANSRERQKLEMALKDTQTHVRDLELAYKEMLRVKYLLPNSVMKTRFLGKLVKILGNPYQSNLHNVRRDFETAHEALRVFVPKTVEQAMEAACERLQEALESQTDELENLTRRYEGAMEDVHVFLQGIVAMETAAQAKA